MCRTTASSASVRSDGTALTGSSLVVPVVWSALAQLHSGDPACRGVSGRDPGEDEGVSGDSGRSPRIVQRLGVVVSTEIDCERNLVGVPERGDRGEPGACSERREKEVGVYDRTRGEPGAVCAVSAGLTLATEAAAVVEITGWLRRRQSASCAGAGAGLLTQARR